MESSPALGARLLKVHGCEVPVQQVGEHGIDVLRPDSEKNLCSNPYGTSAAFAVNGSGPSLDCSTALWVKAVQPRRLPVFPSFFPKIRYLIFPTCDPITRLLEAR